MATRVRQIRAWLVGATVAGSLALGGCTQPAESDGADSVPIGGGPGGGEQVGTIAMQLTLAPGFRFDHIDYEISGNGFHRASTIDVGTSSTISTIVGGIPFGRGYVAQLSGQDVDHRLVPCTGSASFDITSSATMPVPVHLACHEAPNVVAQQVPIPRSAGFALAA